MNPLIVNLLAALAGWLAWNVLLLSIEKDDNEKTFSLKTYALEHWDNWLASLFLIPVLLFFGYRGLGLGVVEMDHLKWSDAYYVCSGFATELVKTIWKKWKAKNVS